jgi:transposase
LTPDSQAHTTPKSRDGTVEMIRLLRVARRGAMKARVAAAEQLHGLLQSGTEELRVAHGRRSGLQLARACAGLRPGALDDPCAATKTALRSIARRFLQLQNELDSLDQQLSALVKKAAPGLVALPGLGVDTAGQLLVTAGDNPERLNSEGSFAHLCGVAPIPACSGRTDRHRLNRGGDRQANKALWRIVLVRMQWHEPTKAYVARRAKQGLSTGEIIRCLKRYVAPDVYRYLVDENAASTTP